jgi:hypothetical protein
VIEKTKPIAAHGFLKVERHAKNERNLGYVRAVQQPARTPNPILEKAMEDSSNSHKRLPAQLCQIAIP